MKDADKIVNRVLIAIVVLGVAFLYITKDPAVAGAIRQAVRGSDSRTDEAAPPPAPVVEQPAPTQAPVYIYLEQPAPTPAPVCTGTDGPAGCVIPSWDAPGTQCTGSCWDRHVAGNADEGKADQP